MLCFGSNKKQCQWPTKIEDPIRAMMLTDVHLLGPLNDNWFERTRVEAQIRRVYQKALSLHQPDVVFILGDLFNEGLYVDDNDFSEYLSRFSDIFETPPHIQRYCLVGNHDIGFHNECVPYFQYSIHDRQLSYFLIIHCYLYTDCGQILRCVLKMPSKKVTIH